MNPWAALTGTAARSGRDTMSLLAGAVIATGTLLTAPVWAHEELRRRCTRLFAGWHRNRIAAYQGVDCAPAAASDRQLVYLALLAPALLGAGAFLTTLGWAFVQAAAVTRLLLPSGHEPTMYVLAATGVIAAVLLGRLAGLADAALARRWLGPSPAARLRRRVDELTTSREAIVAATDAERRRIERDLHDGAQQRLVALAVNLGLARAALADADGPARRAIEQAHDEAKQAVRELRDLVRGLHPAILDEQGLDAALSGLATRFPVPVALTVDLPRRCEPAIEAVAFFVVSEALTNVAKHARATAAHVDVRFGAGGRLRVAVRDDGAGGAEGLRAIRQRVDSVDGTVAVDSPVGGPTSVVVELPCG
ncbi:histidine kinase [Catellatospora citrea]|uniref:sensor histidine kinase n=1 Tax=Catellatospora citrea TaxID=53366 RepID=UPI003402E582